MAFQGIPLPEGEDLHGEEQYVVATVKTSPEKLEELGKESFPFLWCKEGEHLYIALPVETPLLTLKEKDALVRKFLQMEEKEPIGYSSQGEISSLVFMKNDGKEMLDWAIGREKPVGFKEEERSLIGEQPSLEFFNQQGKSFLSGQEIDLRKLLENRSLKEQKERATLLLLSILWEAKNNQHWEGNILPENWGEEIKRADSKEDLLEKLSRLLKGIQPEKLKNYQDKAVDIVKENVKNYLAGTLDLQEITQGTYLTAGYMNTLFKQSVGVTIHQYIISQRLEKAKEILLERQDIKVSSVAEKCGFSNASHFINAFKGKYHCTPSQYRKRGKRNEEN